MILLNLHDNFWGTIIDIEFKQQFQIVHEPAQAQHLSHSESSEQ